MAQPVTKHPAPDLRTTYPRSPNELLGGYVILARTLDKCRAELAGTHGDYHWKCPVAERFLSFTGISPDAFKAAVAEGKTDAEMVDWVRTNSQPHSQDTIQAWNYDCRHWAPETTEKKAFFETERQEVAPEKLYLTYFFELLDAGEGRL